MKINLGEKIAIFHPNSCAILTHFAKFLDLQTTILQKNKARRKANPLGKENTTCIRIQSNKWENNKSPFLIESPLLNWTISIEFLQAQTLGCYIRNSTASKFFK